VLREIGWNVRLADQGDDIVVDEGACTLPLEGQGDAFAIRGFQGNIRLKLWLVLLGDVEDPPELVGQPVGFEVTRGLCQGWGGGTQHESEQEKPALFHSGFPHSSKPWAASVDNACGCLMALRVFIRRPHALL